MQSCLHPSSGTDLRDLSGVSGSVRTAHRDPIDEIRRWAHDVAEFGRPHFGEFALRLEGLRSRILQGCGNPGCRREVCLSDNCGRLASTATVPGSEFVSGSRSVVLQQLEAMISVLRCEESCFTSWQAACRSFEEICQLIQPTDTVQAR